MDFLWIKVILVLITELNYKKKKLQESQHHGKYVCIEPIESNISLWKLNLLVRRPFRLNGEAQTGLHFLTRELIQFVWKRRNLGSFSNNCWTLNGLNSLIGVCAIHCLSLIYLYLSSIFVHKSSWIPFLKKKRVVEFHFDLTPLRTHHITLPFKLLYSFYLYSITPPYFAYTQENKVNTV